MLDGIFPDILGADGQWYCWCCGSLLTTRGDCPICDYPGQMSPPHVCARSGQVFSDEDGCEPDEG